MSRLPHVNWLHTFEAAARHGSFASAADELLLTPAAVSQQIRLLEETLGAKLFKRLPKGVELTDIGQAYALPVRASFVELKTATDGIFRIRSKTSLRVRASISFGIIILAPRLKEFREIHPEIDVVLSTTVWSDRLNDAATDVEIRYGKGDWAEENIWSLGPREATLVCNPVDAVFLRTNRIGLENSDTVPVIGSESDWGQMFEILDIECAVPNPWMPVDSSLLALEVVSSGRGLAIVDKIFSRPYVERGLLAAPFDESLQAQNDFYVVARSGSAKREQIALFYEWLVSTL